MPSVQLNVAKRKNSYDCSQLKGMRGQHHQQQAWKQMSKINNLAKASNCEESKHLNVYCTIKGTNASRHWQSLHSSVPHPVFLSQKYKTIWTSKVSNYSLWQITKPDSIQREFWNKLMLWLITRWNHHSPMQLWKIEIRTFKFVFEFPIHILLLGELLRTFELQSDSKQHLNIQVPGI